MIWQQRRQQLEAYLRLIPQASYPHHSRIHPLKSFTFSHAACFVKREDELGFGISGSKIRKYRTSILFLLAQNIQEVLLIGSAYSNHLLGLSQLLIENGLTPTLFVRGDPQRRLKGNALLISFFIPSSSIHWFSKQEWASVHEHVQAYAQKCPHATFIVPEGACLKEVFPGLLTLPLDIIQNEQDADLSFDRILIDSGTGLTAIALILAYSWLAKNTHIHVWLMAEDRSYFLTQLQHFYSLFKTLMNDSSMPFPTNFDLHDPTKAPRFGQIHSSLFKEMMAIARTEGFLIDPIYSAKLFYEAKQFITQHPLSGNLLLIHSGGALTLMGFEEQLQNALDK